MLPYNQPSVCSTAKPVWGYEAFASLRIVVAKPFSAMQTLWHRMDFDRLFLAAFLHY
jgi:hypothetical protein